MPGTERIFQGNYVLGLAYQIDNTQITALIFLLIIITGLFVWKCPQCSLLKYSWFRVLIAGFVFLYTMFVFYIAHDEAEHIHASWLMSQGMLPFRDFWEHHSPLFWVILTPIYKLTAPYTTACTWVPIITRHIMMFIALATLWVLLSGTRFFDKSGHGKYWLVFYWLAGLTLGYYWQLRPDPFANLLILIALGLLCYGLNNPRVLLCGILLGLAISISPKHLLFCILPLILFVAHKQPIARYTLFILGGILGLLPLFAWLQIHDLTGDFFKWVILYNSTDKGRLFGAMIPLSSIILITGWLFSHRSLRWSSFTVPEQIFIMVILTSIFIGFMQPTTGPKYQYNLQMLFMTQPLIAGIAIDWWQSQIAEQRKRAVLVALTGLLAFMPLIRETGYYTVRGATFERSLNYITTLNKFTKNETVVGIYPFHPLLAMDAINIASHYHYEHLNSNIIKQQVLGILDEVVKRKPSLIFGVESSMQFTGYLRQAELITAREEADFEDFLKANYTYYDASTDIGFWIRNDEAIYLWK